MTFNQVYLMVLMGFSLTLTAHLIWSKSKHVWIALLIVMALVTELSTRKLHDYNTFVYQLYAVLASCATLMLLRTLTKSKFRQKIISVSLMVLIACGVLNFVFFDAALVIPDYYMMVSEPTVIACALLVLGGFITNSEKLQGRPKSSSLIVISILFYYSLRFPFLMLLNNHQKLMNNSSIMLEFHSYLTFAFYLIIGIAGHMHITSLTNERR